MSPLTFRIRPIIVRLIKARWARAGTSFKELDSSLLSPYSPFTHSVIANNDNNRRNNNNNNDNQNNNNQVSLNEGNLVAMQMETGGRKKRSAHDGRAGAFAMVPWSLAQIAVRSVFVFVFPPVLALMLKVSQVSKHTEPSFLFRPR